MGSLDGVPLTLCLVGGMDRWIRKEGEYEEFFLMEIELIFYGVNREFSSPLSLQREKDSIWWAQRVLLSLHFSYCSHYLSCKKLDLCVLSMLSILLQILLPKQSLVSCFLIRIFLKWL